MKPRVRISVFAIFAMAAASAAACSNKHDPTGSGGASQVSLHPTVATQVSGGSLTLTLLRVDNDSRCAVDVTCVWAGNATVVFTIAFAGQVGVLPAQQFLNTTVEPRALVLSGYSFRLDSLFPRAISTHTITQGEYVAYMTVRQMLD